MKKAAVVIDSWKLYIFKRRLDDGGYTYKEFTGPTRGCITLEVKTETIAKLQLVIEAANTEAAQHTQDH